MSHTTTKKTIKGRLTMLLKSHRANAKFVTCIFLKTLLSDISFICNPELSMTMKASRRPIENISCMEWSMHFFDSTANAHCKYIVILNSYVNIDT